MADEPYTLEGILGDLELLRSHEEELAASLTALLDAPDLPEHIRRVFKLAREAFKDGASRFLMHPHWKLNYEAPIVVAQTVEGAHEVEMLLGRIIHGICV